MNEVEYILRIVLKARDDLAKGLAAARREIRGFAKDISDNQGKIDAFNTSMLAMEKNVKDVTSRFEEWRAVMQGTSRGNADAKKSFGDLGREVDSTAKAQKRAADATQRAEQAQQKLRDSSDKLYNEYKKLHAAEAQNDEDRKFSIFRLQAIGREIETLAKKVDDPKVKRMWFDRAQESKQALNSILHDISVEDQAKADLIKKDIDRAEKRRSITERDNAARAAQTRAREIASRISGQREISSVDRDNAEQTVIALKHLSTEYKSTSRTAQTLRIASKNLDTELKNVGRDSDRTRGFLGNMKQSLDHNKESAAGLDNTLRGMGWLIAAGFAQQLITVLGGLAGQLVAVAGSAAQAGAALGGILAAGMAQAIPVVGLLGAAFAQAKASMDAMKAAQLARQQAFTQGADADKRTADAADAIANANRRLENAQEGLTKARREGRRELQDLIKAENDAKLAAIGAALSQKEAQQALIKAQATGDTEGIQRAQLALLQAQSDAQDSLNQKKRAAADADRGRRGGVEGLEGVKQARDQVADANRAVETAKRNAGEAAAGADTAANKLQFLLSQMTKGQVALFHALEDLRKAYQKDIGPISDIILGSFTRAVRGITKIMQSPELLGNARKLATEISKQLDRIFDSFTDEKTLKQFYRFASEARKNLGPVTDIIITLGHAFLDIAEAAGPAFSEFLGFLGDLVGGFGDLAGNKGKMEDFFTAGEKHLESWIKLGLSVINLFIALSGAGGAESGKKSIDDATKAIDNLTKKVNANKGDVADFFERAREVAYQVVDVLAVLAEELEKTFTPERIKNFADLLKTVIIPALGDAITFMGNFVEQILKFADTPLGKNLIQFGIAAFLVMKIFGSAIKVIYDFGEAIFYIVRPFVLLLKHLPGVQKLVAIVRALVFALGEASAVTVFAWVIGIAAAIALVIIILQKLGLLDDAWRAIKGTFTAFWKEVKPSLDHLIKSIQEMWTAIKEGKGLFAIFKVLASVLRPVLKAVIDIGAIFLRVFGRTLGRIIGGVIDILSGLIDFITGVFTGDWDKAWDGIKRIFRGFFRAVTSVFRALPELLGDIAKKILPAFKKGINALWNWLEKLPERLADLATKGAHAFVKAFHNVGGDVIKGIVSGMKSGVGFAKDIANSFIDLLNHLLPNKLSIPGAPDINLPNNPIPHLAAGGPVPGQGRGDKIAALLEPGEHVLTRQEVAAMGGHGAVFALRRALGGGGQGSGGRFAEGGAAVAGGLTVSFQGGGLDDFRSTWRQFWTALVLITRQGSNLVEAQFRDMRVNTTRSADRMYRDVRHSISDIQDSFKVRGNRIVNSWSDMWDSIKKVTHEGLFYIGHETNKALHGLGEKHIDFGLSAPQKSDGKAGGGWIGSKGQRGRDMGFYPLGAGEAVLNWQHQKYVEPAMNAYYGHGLSTMFGRVRGLHAGDGSGPGFAGGRKGVDALFDGHPSNVVSGIIDIVRLLKKKFPGLLVTSTRDHGAITSTGGLSDHPSGHAVDIASGDYSIMDRATAYIKSSGIAKKLKQGIHNPGLAINQGKNVGAGFFAGAWAQHANHIHLAMAGALGRVADMITSIAKQTVEGPDGGLKSIMQAAIDTVRKAANKFIDDKSASATDTAGPPGGPGTPAPKGQHRRWIIAGLRLAGVPVTEGNISAQYTLDMGESGGVAKIVQQVHDINSVTGNLARGIAQVIPPTFATYKVPGHGNIDNPVDNIAASAKYQIARYGHLVGHSGYARGGEIPGQPGAPVPILAHAREWVLNVAQQARLAQLIGMSRSGLRSLLGFHGPSHTAQGGTEATEIAPITDKDIKGIDSRVLRRIVRQLQKIGENFTKASVDIGSVETWTTFLGTSLTTLRRMTRRLHAKKDEVKKKDTDFDKGIGFFVDSVDGMLAETTGMFSKLRTSIERRATVMARRLLRRQFSVTGGVVSRTDERSEELVQQGIARRELVEQRRQRPELVRERQRIARGLRQVRRQQGRAGLDDTQRARLQTEETQLRTMLDDAKQRVTDNISAIYEAQQAYLEAQLTAQQAFVDAISQRYEAANAGLDLFRRVATAIGNEDAIQKINAKQRELLTSQANELEARIGGLRAIGTKGANEAADQIAAQVADLRVQIFESIQQELRDAVERINTRTQRRLGRLDLGGRMLDAVGAVGLGAAASLGGERFTRAGIFAQRGQALEAQRTGLQGVLRGAQAAGNIQLVQDLTDQLAELDVTIKENTKAAFDAKTEAINNRASLVTTQSDLRSQIITLTGQISGNTNQAALLTEANVKATALQEQRTGLLAQLAVAQAAKNTAAVDDLTTQLLQNELAILQNTQATNELTGNLSKDQGFTSTAWEVFSQAIFTGSGGLLPMYQSLFPSAAIGANVLGSGMLMAHAGEKIVPAKVGALGGAGNMGDTNYFDIDINEAGRPIDWAGAATAIMFKKSGAK